MFLYSFNKIRIFNPEIISSDSDIFLGQGIINKIVYESE